MNDGWQIGVRLEPGGSPEWAFYFVNDTDRVVDDLVLESVGYEWGDMGNTEEVFRKLGSLEPRSFLLAWRDDSDAAELRIELKFRARIAGQERSLSFEIPKLYRIREDRVTVPILGPARYVTEPQK